MTGSVAPARRRMFVALYPPDAARAELREAIAPELRHTTRGLRWTPPDDWHITLAFLGDVDDTTVAALRARLAGIGHPPLRLALQGGGSFGRRVLWAGVGGDLAGLTTLADAVRKAAAAAGIALEDLEFHPHLTLARARRGRNLRPLVDQLAGFAGIPWQAQAVYLVESRPGPRYVPLDSWELGDR